MPLKSVGIISLAAASRRTFKSAGNGQSSIVLQMVQTRIHLASQLYSHTERNRGTLSKSERLAYIDAVKCLQSTPAKSPKSVVPGAKTRFDDFVATHINQTNTIHYTGSFLSWHRYFVWLYERALQTECGYEGTQPVSVSSRLYVSHSCL